MWQFVEDGAIYYNKHCEVHLLIGTEPFTAILIKSDSLTPKEP